MRDYKKYLLFIYYGSEGWSVCGQADTKEEAVKMYMNMYGQGSEILLVRNIPAVLKFEDGENNDEDNQA